jgi:hypothetical protein
MNCSIKSRRLPEEIYKFLYNTPHVDYRKKSLSMQPRGLRVLGLLLGKNCNYCASEALFILLKIFLTIRS